MHGGKLLVELSVPSEGKTGERGCRLGGVSFTLEPPQRPKDRPARFRSFTSKKKNIPVRGGKKYRRHQEQVDRVVVPELEETLKPRLKVGQKKGELSLPD